MYVLNGCCTCRLVPHHPFFHEHVDTGFFRVSHYRYDYRSLLQEIYLVRVQPFPSTLFEGPFSTPVCFSENLFFYVARGDDYKFPALHVEWTEPTYPPQVLIQLPCRRLPLVENSCSSSCF